jgi:hypothetical protein
MSTFNRFCNSVKQTFKKISNKTEDLLDSTSNAIKIKNLEMKIDEQYENLGRIVYRDLHTEEDLEEEKLRTVAAIDALFDRITELKNAPAAKAEQAEADCEQPAAEEAAEEEAPAAEEATEEEAPAAKE